MSSTNEFVTVAFEEEQYCRTKKGLAQWDREKTLRVYGISTDDTVQIHFCLAENYGEAVSVEAAISNGAIEASIPPFIFEKKTSSSQRVYYAYAFIYLLNGESAETVRKIIFEIETRPKPEDYVYYPEDVKTWSKKVNLPLDEAGNPDNGTAGQFAVSDGQGGITWLTVENESETSGDAADVAYDNTNSGLGADNVQDAIDKLSKEKVDKATLENGVIKFYKSGETDKELFTVDISSIGGTGGLDLNNLTLSVSQVGEYQRLSMSDGTTTKTVDIPITAITDEQVQTAVDNYFGENTVMAVDFEKHIGNLFNGVKYNKYPSLGENIFETKYLDSEYYKYIVFRAKPNTSYVITAPSIVTDEGFGQADANGICTQVPVGTLTENSPVNYINFKVGTGGLGKFISFKTNDNFLEDTTYLVWKTDKNVDLSNAVVFEGENVNDYANIGEYSEINGTVTSGDLLVTEDNFERRIIKSLQKANTSIQMEDFESTEYAFATHLNGQRYSYPMINSFAIGDAQKLFNSARICKADADHLRIGSYYSHCPTMKIINDKAYIVSFENKTNSTDHIQYTTIELYIVDIASWTVTEQKNVAITGLTCGSETLKYGGIDPNVLNINDETLRIIFTTQFADGQHCICYRDYDVQNNSLGDIGLCKISDGTTDYDFNVEGVKSVCGTFTATNPILNMATQYATYNNEHYIGLGVDSVYENIPILKTSDFITFTLWSIPIVEGNKAHYECACAIGKRADGSYRLFTATRQVKDEKYRMLLTVLSLTDGSVIEKQWIPDGGARPYLYFDGYHFYMFHVLDKDRGAGTITRIGVNSISNENIQSYADTFAMVYASVVEYGDCLMVAYMRSFKMYIAKIPKLPIYSHEEVIPIINKFLDLFVAE